MQAIKSYKPFVAGLTGFIFWLVTCPQLWGQDNQKRFLTKEEYSLWSKLVARKLSNNGDWASYLLLYESKKDTLFVKSTKNNVTYYFPNAKDGEFNGESEFACIARDTLLLQNLSTGNLNKTPNVYDFAFSSNEHFLAVLIKQAQEKYTLEIKDATGKVQERISDVSQWYFEPKHTGVVYATASGENHSIGFINLENPIIKKMILSDSKSDFQSLIWKNNTIAFLQNTKDNLLLLHYNIKKDRLRKFDPISQKGFPLDMKISAELYNSLMVSDDGNRIFFWLKENEERLHTIDPDAVQIWNTQDRLLFDHKKYIGEISLLDKMAVWSLKENKFLQITDRQLPRGFLTADYTHALIYDPIAYEPQNNFEGPFDLYIVDLQTGKRKCILEQYTSDQIPIPSTDGNYLSYAKEGHWWIYDIKKDTHTHITLESSESFFKENQDMPVEASPYGIGGWTADGSIILYDKYDLWQIPWDGSVKKRLTHGREIQKTYRIKDFSEFRLNDIEAKKATLDLNSGFILETKDKKTGASGFSKWTLSGGISDMVWENKKISQLSKARNVDSYMYIEQSYELSPRLMMYDGRPKQIVETNKQQQHFYWGKAEAIEYTACGKNLQGILYYPAGYNKETKYPMIVHIYERQFQYFNDYENPSLYSSDGFNTSHFTQQGYFVLLPDMGFEIGNLADSTKKSVLAAVDIVLKKASIDPKKVGLNGHSFGGYETDLIITQTDRFATAVSGAAWTDLISSYLYVGGTFKRPDFYRAEHDQLRIGKSLFEDTESYLKNSPVLQAANVTTPLLGWTGEDDRHIHSLQSMEFYMALRRLGKTHTLLVYPEEGHNLEQRKNQKDLTKRIGQWFDYYLKNGKQQQWMKNNFK
ncbi:S9 family peptidase [Flavobacterium aestivum]|uniref:S9 family peptidase n=1 Tax=Flavobacterium aestivum TaxID=3003257 RepID=UPI0024832744|nr:prolyl oligopeptidase family serine peptidase [Flavobacterium aestivum]